MLSKSRYSCVVDKCLNLSTRYMTNDDTSGLQSSRQQRYRSRRPAVKPCETKEFSAGSSLPITLYELYSKRPQRRCPFDF